MDEKLSELINIISKKFSTTIITTSKHSESQVNFPVPLILNSKFEDEIGLMFFSAYNSVYNITDENNTFNFSHKDYKVPPGAREIKNINSELQNIIGKDTNGAPLITIEVNSPTSKCKLIIKGNIQFKTLGSILGFNSDKI